MKFDPQPYAEHYRAENEAELSAIRERVSAALAEARSLAERILREDAGVRAVILFGSLAEEGPRRKDFDIDVVRLDRLPPHVRARINARGIVLAGSRTAIRER